MCKSWQKQEVRGANIDAPNYPACMFWTGRENLNPGGKVRECKHDTLLGFEASGFLS